MADYSLPYSFFNIHDLIVAIYPEGKLIEIDIDFFGYRDGF